MIQGNVHKPFHTTLWIIWTVTCCWNHFFCTATTYLLATRHIQNWFKTCHSLHVLKCVWLKQILSLLRNMASVTYCLIVMDNYGYWKFEFWKLVNQILHLHYNCPFQLPASLLKGVHAHLVSKVGSKAHYQPDKCML